MRFLPVLWLMLHTLPTLACFPDHVRLDEEITFAPTNARLSEDGKTWLLPIEGWIYEPEENSVKRRLLLEVLQEALDLEEFDPKTPIFSRRVRRFLVDDVEDRQVFIRLAGEQHLVGTSGDGGYFSGQLKLTDERVRGLAQSSASGNSFIRYQAITGPGDDRKMEGLIQLIRPTGLSVISDIDDTIKVTEVLDHEAAAKNTFVRDFKAVGGMASVYRKWEKLGASFHYVSASPWQLYPELVSFLKGSGYPEGSFNLKQVSFSNVLDPAGETKLPVVDNLVRNFPGRRFILVGDSGQEDPEIYGQVARAHPAQIELIAIRGLRDPRDTDERYQAAFRDLDPKLWRVFHDPAELADYQPR